MDHQETTHLESSQPETWEKETKLGTGTLAQDESVDFTNSGFSKEEKENVNRKIMSYTGYQITSAKFDLNW